jgi:plasmid replication initiation protein
MVKAITPRKKKQPKVYKNKKLNNANFGNYNLNEYQVFLQLVSKIKGIDNTGEYLLHERLQKDYTITAQEFSETFKVDVDTVYRILKKSTHTLARTAVTLQKPDLFQTWEIPVCRYAMYNHKEGCLTIKFNEEMMPYFAQMTSRFVLYNLKEVANFGSLYTTRLYELIQEFKDTGYIIKTIEDLRSIFAVGNNYKLYADFKRKTFAHAVDEINNNYNMKLKFEESKTGRKVTSIKFTFKKTTTKKAYNPYTKNMCNVYKSPQAICDDKQGKLLDTENSTLANISMIKTKKKSQIHITDKERLVIDIMLRLLQDNPKLNRKEALQKAKDCVGID